MSLVVRLEQVTDDAGLRDGAEWCVRRYAEPADDVEPGSDVAIGTHVSLQPQADGRKTFFLSVDEATKVGLYAQHMAEEPT